MAEMRADDAPGFCKKRFVTVSEEGYKKLIIEKDALNTHRATDVAVQTFKAYLAEKQLSEDFENYTADQLDSTLSRFYTEARIDILVVQ